MKNIQFLQELNYLRQIYGFVNMHSVFRNVDNYKAKRSYMSFKELEKELKNIFIP